MARVNPEIERKDEKMNVDLQTLSSQYTALLEDLDENIAASRVSIADIGTVRAVLDKLDAMVVDVLTAAVAESVDRKPHQLKSIWRQYIN